VPITLRRRLFVKQSLAILVRMVVDFEAELWIWDARRDDSWTFVSLPVEASDEIRDRSGGRRRGFGSVRVEARVGTYVWRTSIFPDSPAIRADADAKAQKRAIPSLAPGDRVVHDSFGMGSVVALDGVGDKAVASIDFGSQGVKRLLLRYAPVEKL